VTWSKEIKPSLCITVYIGLFPVDRKLKLKPSQTNPTTNHPKHPPSNHFTNKTVQHWALQSPIYTKTLD
jgi:hypothetical protein